MSTILNAQKIREEFSMLQKKEPWIYFDNAATALKPKSVVEAICSYYDQECSTVHRGLYPLAQKNTDRQFKARKKLQAFIHAKSEREIIFTSGTTDAINLLSFSLGEAFIQEGDEILIPEIEHHSNLVPWQMLAQRKKAHLKVIHCSEKGEMDLDDLEIKLNARTKIVSFAHTSNIFGITHPVKRIVELIRSKSEAKILLDAAQSIAHTPIDVQSLDVDFLVFSAHKLYGPTGIGVLYGKEELLEKLPPYQGGGDMIQEVSFDQTTYNELPYKFEAGTPHIAGIMGLNAAIEFIESYGLQAIQAYEKELTSYALKRLKELEEVKIIGDSNQLFSLISFTIEGAHPLDVATFLGFKKIALRSGHLCAQTALKRLNLSSVMRISFAPYNTFEEIDAFVLALQSILNKLKTS